MKRCMAVIIFMLFVRLTTATGQEVVMPEQVEYSGQIFIRTEGWQEYEEVRYADIDGDAREEAIIRMKTYKDGFPAAFTLIYDNKEGEYTLKQTILTGETPKRMDIADVNGDGILDLILYDHSGNHYTQIRIYSFQGGEYKCLFENGTACYAYDVKTDLMPTRIVIGRENWEDEEFCYANSDTRSLLEVWIWNGEEFEYSPAHSTVRMIPEIEAIQITTDKILGTMREIEKESNSKEKKALSGLKNENAVFFIADIDGANIKMVRAAHQLDMVGGPKEDEYYGFLIAGVKALEPSDKPNKWTSILFDPQGNAVKEIEDIDGFWEKHEKTI